MKTLDDVLKNSQYGLYYGNRIFLPFVADLLKACIQNDLITDFSCNNKGANYRKALDFTEVYFYDYKDLSDVITKYENIKLIIVEEGKDIFDFNNHRKIVLHLEENHKLKIEEVDEDILFIE